VRRGLALASIAAVLAITGCGDDSSGETTAPAVSIPAVTAPIAPTTTTPATTSTSTGTTRTGNGGTGPPAHHGNPNGPDSATNDVPPPAGSPQAAFEKQCKQNPQACG
jgi:hypothetical protein